MSIVSINEWNDEWINNSVLSDTHARNWARFLKNIILHNLITNSGAPFHRENTAFGNPKSSYLLVMGEPDLTLPTPFLWIQSPNLARTIELYAYQRWWSHFKLFFFCTTTASSHLSMCYRITYLFTGSACIDICTNGRKCELTVPELVV